MDSVYLISLIVGGFFVLLSIFGGADHEAEADFDADFDHDFEMGAEIDGEVDLDAEADHDLHVDVDSDVSFVDLLSIRALFLFAAFFGLTGTLFTWFGGTEPMTAVWSTLTGLVVGLGGNYVIKKFAYEQVSSNVTSENLQGKTGRVILPFGRNDRGKILVEARGQRISLLARPLDEDSEEAFNQGEEVVVVRIEGRVAEVVKPT